MGKKSKKNDKKNGLKDIVMKTESELLVASVVEPMYNLKTTDVRCDETTVFTSNETTDISCNETNNIPCSETTDFPSEDGDPKNPSSSSFSGNAGPGAVSVAETTGLFQGI